jgi:hypothetical protein
MTELFRLKAFLISLRGFYRRVILMGMLPYEPIHNKVMDRMVKVIKRDLTRK